MKPIYNFSKVLNVINRKGEDRHATVQAIIKTSDSFVYEVLLDDGTRDFIGENDLKVIN